MGNYDFPSVVAAKILVINQNKVLLVREPDFNDWMPNRLGLPGGKPLLNETIKQALERKIKTEIGVQIELDNLAQIQNILMPDKNVYMFLFVAKYISGEIDADKIESKDINWYSLYDIEQLTNDDFTEYYNRDFIIKVLTGKYHAAPLDLIIDQDNRTPAIQEWMEKGQK